eukprot:RCo049450
MPLFGVRGVRGWAQEQDFDHLMHDLLGEEVALEQLRDKLGVSHPALAVEGLLARPLWAAGRLRGVERELSLELRLAAVQEHLAEVLQCVPTAPSARSSSSRGRGGGRKRLRQRRGHVAQVPGHIGVHRAVRGLRQSLLKKQPNHLCQHPHRTIVAAVVQIEPHQGLPNLLKQRVVLLRGDLVEQPSHGLHGLSHGVDAGPGLEGLVHSIVQLREHLMLEGLLLLHVRLLLLLQGHRLQRGEGPHQGVAQVRPKHGRAPPSRQHWVKKERVHLRRGHQRGEVHPCWKGSPGKTRKRGQPPARGWA